MATIYDVAKLARVSTYTVSSVLNQSAKVSPELTERVLKAVGDLDYTPNEVARSLQTRRSRTVGMLIPDIANPFYAKVVRGVEDRLKQDGYSLVLGNTYNDASEQARYLSVFRARQADGLLVFLATGSEADLQRLVGEHKPVVFVAREPRGFEADIVTADNRKGARLAVEHLLARGHRRIGVIVGELDLSTSS
jgi:DNA-binding LacI/PurR family transcriptional regulator